MYNYYIKLSDARYAIMDYIGEQTVSKYASAKDCKLVRDGAEGAMNALDYMPPADVVPKSEYDSEIKGWQELYADTVSKWEKAYEELEIKLENAKADVAREIFEEIEQVVGLFTIENQCAIVSLVEIAELKKKYTEGGKSK